MDRLAAGSWDISETTVWTCHFLSGSQAEHETPLTDYDRDTAAHALGDGWERGCGFADRA
jgi:hypothetical protein